MNKIYEKIGNNLKEIKKIQDLIRQGLGRPGEKQHAFDLAKEAGDLFADDISKRKAEKLGKVTIWTSQTHDGFVSPGGANQLNDWVALLEEYLDKRKIKADLSNEKIHIHSAFEPDTNDQHIFITEKGSQEKAHMVVDGDTGEIRIDPKDKSPHGLIKSIKTELELATGETVQATKTSLNFVESGAGPKPDVRAYTATKDGYFVLEIYNSSDEDLEDFIVRADWVQPLPEGSQNRIIEQFNNENDYLVMTHPRSLNVLKAKEKVYAHIPSISIDKKIKITITCRGIQSSRSIERVFDLETQNQYK